MSVVNPFDFFVEPYAEQFPFAYQADIVEELAAYRTPEPAGPRLAALIASLPKTAPRTVDMLVELNAQSATADPLRDPHGAGRAGARRHAEARLRLLPRHCVAAGADRAAPRPRGAVRVRLSHPAEGRHRSARRTAGNARRFLRPACLGGDLSAGRGLDRLRCHLGPPVRRGAHSAVRGAPLSLRRADLGRRRTGEDRVRVRHGRDPHSRSAAGHLAVLGRDVGEARPDGRAGRPRPRRAGRAPDHGRRADLHLDRRLRDCGMEYGGGRPDQAHPCRRTGAAIAPALWAERLSALRAGQVVSRRKPAALGLRTLLAQGRRADLERSGHRRG